MLLAIASDSRLSLGGYFWGEGTSASRESRSEGRKEERKEGEGWVAAY